MGNAFSFIGSDLILNASVNIAGNQFSILDKRELDAGLPYRVRVKLDSTGECKDVSQDFLGKSFYENQFAIAAPVGESNVSFTLSNGEQLSTRINLTEKGSLNCHIKCFMKTPWIVENEGTRNYTPFVIASSQIITVLIVLSIANEHPADKISGMSVYESVGGKLGFFMTDIALLNTYLRKELGEGIFDLLQLLTSTELADQLFDNGLLVLVWGIPSYPYMISFDIRNKCLLGDKLDYEGVYKLSGSIKKMSIVPGEHLKTWNTAGTNQVFPEIVVPDTEEGDQFFKLETYALKNQLSPFKERIMLSLLFDKASEVAVSPMLNVDLLEA